MNELQNDEWKYFLATGLKHENDTFYPEAVADDGNCFYRSLCVAGLSLYFETSHDTHDRLRQTVVNYMIGDGNHIAREIYSQFGLQNVTFNNYIETQRKNGTWAGDMEALIISIMFKIRIKIINNINESLNSEEKSQFDTLDHFKNHLPNLLNDSLLNAPIFYIYCHQYGFPITQKTPLNHFCALKKISSSEKNLLKKKLTHIFEQTKSQNNNNLFLERQNVLPFLSKDDESLILISSSSSTESDDVHNIKNSLKRKVCRKKISDAQLKKRLASDRLRKSNSKIKESDAERSDKLIYNCKLQKTFRDKESSEQKKLEMSKIEKILHQNGIYSNYQITVHVKS